MTGELETGAFCRRAAAAGSGSHAASPGPAVLLVQGRRRADQREGESSRRSRFNLSL